MDPVRNFAIVTVYGAYDYSDDTIQLEEGEASKLPDIDTEGEFNLVWWNAEEYPNPAEDPDVEIVRVTDINYDELTITRAEEDTDATGKSGGSKMALVITKKTIDDIVTAQLNARDTGNSMPYTQAPVSRRGFVH